MAKIDDLRKQIDRLPYSELQIKMQLLVMAAYENAYDTIAEGSEESEEAIADSSLQVLLGDERDAAVTGWFRDNGFSW